MYTRIIVGVDGSQPAEEALTIAARLANEHGGELVLAHSADGSKEQGEALLAQASARAKQLGVNAGSHMFEGDPAENLLRLAAETGCGLIVAGTHGRHGPGRTLIGSTTEAILREATIPVLTVRSGELATATTGPLFHTVVVGVDDSEPSDAAVATALALFGHGDRALLFYSVVDVDRVTGALRFHAKLRDELHAQAEEIVGKAVALARAQGVSARGHVSEGRADEELMVACTGAVHQGKQRSELSLRVVEGQADLIVVGSHGRRGLQRFLLGSVSESVVRTARVPVLVVRTAPRVPVTLKTAASLQHTPSLA